jgi:hypothetical protein
VGVWSNQHGWGNGKGRYGMLIITGVSTTGLARGYYLWGPPTKLSWNQGPAGFSKFAEYIANGNFSFQSGGTINTRLDDNNTLTLSTLRSDKPSEKADIQLKPIWQLAMPSKDGAKPSTGKETSPESKSRPDANSPRTDKQERHKAQEKQSTEMLRLHCRQEAHRLAINNASSIESCVQNGGKI